MGTSFSLVITYISLLIQSLPVDGKLSWTCTIKTASLNLTCFFLLLINCIPYLDLWDLSIPFLSILLAWLILSLMASHILICLDVSILFLDSRDYHHTGLTFVYFLILVMVSHFLTCEMLALLAFCLFSSFWQRVSLFYPLSSLHSCIIIFLVKFVIVFIWITVVTSFHHCPFWWSSWQCMEFHRVSN